eukprot:6187812-Amphidinium_carterae.1
MTFNSSTCIGQMLVSETSGRPFSVEPILPRPKLCTCLEPFKSPCSALASGTAWKPGHGSRQLCSKYNPKKQICLSLPPSKIPRVCVQVEFLSRESREAFDAVTH